MPTYQYLCNTCEQGFDVIQTMDDKPLKTVPSTSGPCGKKCKSPVQRILSVPNVNLRQGKAEVLRDQNNTETVKHWDGRQDVTVRPEPVRAGLKVPKPG